MGLTATIRKKTVKSAQRKKIIKNCLAVAAAILNRSTADLLL